MPLPRFAFVVAAAALLVGCGGADRLAADDNEAAEAVRAAAEAVRDAERNGAERLAADELDRAKTRLDRARAAAEIGDHGSSLRLAREADATAELAEVLALSAKSQNAARELRATIALLREEIRRLQAE